MLAVFYGEDRARALAAAHRLLGSNYEVIEGENLEPADLPSVFLGGSLFDAERRILIKGLLTNKNSATIASLPKYLDSSHQIVLLEDKLDKRSAIYKALAKVADIKEFKLPEQVNKNLAFNIYDTALRNGPKAVQMTEELIKTNSAPNLVIGAWAYKATQNYRLHPHAKERKILQDLAELDLRTKSSDSDTWLLVKTFLLKLSSC